MDHDLELALEKAAVRFAVSKEDLLKAIDHPDIKPEEKPYIVTAGVTGLNVKVFSIGEADIYGGGLLRGISPKQNMIILDLADNFTRQKVTIQGLKMTPNLKRLARGYKAIFIRWFDGGTPGLDTTFWLDLIKYIKETKKDILVCCDGGHGRTGTALAILAFLSGATEDPIAFVRENYCEEAVETERQVNYINEICGLNLTDAPSRSNFEILGYTGEILNAD